MTALSVTLNCAMDDQKRIAALQRQKDEAQGGRPANFESWRQRAHATLRTVMGPTHPAVSALDRVSYSLGFATENTPQSSFDRARERGVMQAVAILEGAVLEIELGAPTEPPAALVGLHPWILDAAAELWQAGRYRLAVDEAAAALERQIRNKVRSHQTGTPLVTSAFNPDPPKAGERRLRFPEFAEGTASWTNAHDGAMAFARGCMMRIRNLQEHDEWDETEARDSLGALSLLARWTEGAVVVEAEPPRSEGKPESGAIPVPLVAFRRPRRSRRPR
jgi:hypothetical protein